MSELSYPSTPQFLTPSKKNAENQIFKEPAVPPPKKKRSKVLDEDTYVEEMAKIIQRDFFPDLEKLKAQNDFLDATERKDHQKLRELYIKYSGGQRPPTERYASPATFETPGHGTPLPPGTSAEFVEEGGSERSLVSAKPKPKISPHHTLDSYLSAYTSEDNNSFQDLMEAMAEKSRAKFAEQLQDEHDSKLKLLQSSIVPSIEQQADHYKKPEALDSWGYKAKNFIMYVPDGEPAPPVSPNERRIISYSNTRLDVDPFDYQRNKETISQIAKSQEKILSGRIGVDGSTLLDSKNKQGSGLGLGGLGGGSASTAETTGVRLLPIAHTFVRTPSPCPGAPGETPLMTWGEIEGTPFRLDGGDTPLPGKGSGTSFKMAETSKREQIAISLAEKASQRHRAQKQKAMDAVKRSMLTPSPRMATGTTADKLALMSPAAQRLASAHLKRHLPGLTPSPLSTPSSTPGRLTPLLTGTSRSGGGSTKSTTPIVSRKRTDRVDSGSASSSSDDKKARKNLTDDLLQINLPKRNRLKASDFFS